MPFSPISVNSKTFNQAGDGRYMLSGIAFGDPVDYFKISPGSRNAKTGLTSAAITRIKEKDVVVNGVTTRRSAQVSLPIQVPEGFTSADLDAMASDISEFITAGILDRILGGDS